MEKIKTILLWGTLTIAAFIGFSEPTAEILPIQIIAWGILIILINKERLWGQQ